MSFNRCKKKTHIVVHKIVPDQSGELILFGSHYWSPCIFLHFRQQKMNQGTLGTHRQTLIRSRIRLGPYEGPFYGPYRAPKMNLKIFEPLSGCICYFYIIHYTLYILAPLTMLEHFCGHCGTLPRLRGPSWTFMDPKRDPKMDPARLIPGDPL